MFSSKGKGVILLMVSVILVLAGNRVTAAGISETTTIQHVYLNDEFVGSVTDGTEIEKIVADKVEEAQEEYPDYTFDKDTQLKFVPEEVFDEDVKEDQAVKVIQDQLNVKAEAYEIDIDNQAVAYVASKEDAEDVLEKITLLYVNEEEYAEYESGKKDADSLKEPGSRILDIEFSLPVTFKEKMVYPDEIKSVDKTLSMIEEGKEETTIYEAKEDEDLEAIATNHDMDLDQLLELNPGQDEDKGVKEGERLYVTQRTPYVNVMVEREVLKEERIPFEKKVEEDDELPKGELITEQMGNEGILAFTYNVSETNGKKISETIVKKEVTEKAKTEITRKGTKVIPSQGSGTYSWPADGGYISSKQGQRWGKLHKGIDIARPATRTITAADHGIIEIAGNSGGYGNKITINHNNGYKTVYAHLDSIDVKAGQKIEKGMKIGMMGSTGHSTGVHLHFEIYKNGSLVNPLNYISQ
ncbi:MULTISPECIES: peptidoglycan DD-metalloendopeptidase family protein [unclassified Bacillus (in: firmicutes)]|uniref:peptidoglycan DD-metalloendopeptidase family protein n=1 Tax=unclassified Bacillus (in: firmicutes) TaxID=185979 RepID=UPI001BEC0963|nr:MULTISPECIES: M23 family metallopeptidase [unclassified Bacillus (in: firmicutes)]MBT2617328.1 M23 family metallopeptidase [Bacillus sp. ISL-78]MBT2630563.1 M23 family metallopeptidase [Bacillus sp. ISL-101]MBT2717201.1 M23 family metallopeptidase [Bacillus sp. ISL-57]